MQVRDFPLLLVDVILLCWSLFISVLEKSLPWSIPLIINIHCISDYYFIDFIIYVCYSYVVLSLTMYE